MLAFGIICLIMVFEGSMVLVNLKKIGNLSKHLYQEDVNSIRRLQEIQNHMNASRLLIFRHLGEEDTKTMNGIEENLTTEIKITEELVGDKSTYFLDREDSVKLEELNKLWNALSQKYVEVIQLSSDYMKDDGYRIVNNEAQKKSDKAVKIFEELLHNKNQSLDENYRQSEDVKTKTIHAMLLAIGAGIVMAVILGIVISNRFSKQILTLVNRAQDIAQGSLDKDALNVTSKDELGVLAGSFNKMQQELEGVIGTIAQSANKLAGSTKEISSMIQEQTGVVSQQSSSVVEISSTVDELSASSTGVAENSAAVAKISTKSLHECERGLGAIKSLTTKIEHIADDNKIMVDEILDLGKKSKEIGTVVDIIKNVADQTKLIAFNAALEASSAGEAGERFGYVASEIRRLADNVMQSTVKIQNIVDYIQEAMDRLVKNAEEGASKFQDGTGLASKTSSELENLVSGVKKTADAATQISLSTKEQQTSTKQVLASLNEIGSGSRHSSAAMEQISSITQNLSRLAETLQRMVKSFSINYDSDEFSGI